MEKEKDMCTAWYHRSTQNLTTGKEDSPLDIKTLFAFSLNDDLLKDLKYSQKYEEHFELQGSFETLHVCEVNQVVIYWIDNSVSVQGVRQNVNLHFDF